MQFFRRPPSPEQTEGTDVVEPEIVAGKADDTDLPPSRLRGTEPLYGYVVALELLVVAILNVVITTGKGAPAHPQRTLQIVGILAPVVFVAVLQARNRTLAGFAAIVAAFFVTLPKAPSSLGVAHVFALAIPLAYGLIITQRQRRAVGNSARAGGRRDAAAGRKGAPVSRSGDTKGKGAEPARRRGRKRKGEEEASGPRASARYTPPKTKRGKARR